MISRGAIHAVNTSANQHCDLQQHAERSLRSMSSDRGLPRMISMRAMGLFAT